MKFEKRESEQPVESIEYLSVDEIIPNRFQPRKTFNDKELEDLAESIDQNGLLQPISVRKIHDAEHGDKYELIAGERRWRAHKLLGKSRIKAIVGSFDDNKSAALALIENLQRSNLSGIEEAYALRNLMDMYGYNADKMAKKIGKSRSYVANAVRLINLPDDVKAMISLKKLDSWHGLTLLSLPTAEVQSELAHKAIEKEWSVADLKTAVEKITGKDEARKNNEKKKGLTEETKPSLETVGTEGPKHPVPDNYILIKVDSQEELEDISASLSEAGLTVFFKEDIRNEIKKATSPIKSIRESVAVKKADEETVDVDVEESVEESDSEE